MKVEAVLDVLKSTLDLPLTDSQKVLLIKQLIDGVEFRLNNK